MAAFMEKNIIVFLGTFQSNVPFFGKDSYARKELGFVSLMRVRASESVF